MEKQGKKMLEYLKNTSYEKTMKSSILLKQTGLTEKQFKYYFYKLKGDGLVGHEVHTPGHTAATAKTQYADDSYAFFITSLGLKALRRDYTKIISLSAIVIAAITSSLLLALKLLE